MQPTNEPTAAQQSAGIKLKTARPWRVAVVAFLIFLVLIAVFGNQWVTDKIGKHYRGAKFIDNAARSVRTYQWRFSPPGGHDYGHVWLGNLALVGTVLVLTLLLVAVVARGRGGFGQTFVGTWLVVVGATVLASWVRATIIAPGEVGLTSRSKLNAIFFSSLAPGGSALFAALAFGFIVALVAGLAALLSRRTEVLAAPAAADSAFPVAADDDDAPPMWERVDAPYEPAAAAPPYQVPYQDVSYAAAPPNPTAPAPTVQAADASDATTQLPIIAAQSDQMAQLDATTQLPIIPAQPDETSGDQTTQFPRIDPDEQQR